MLTLTQARQQQDVAIGKLKCIVMLRRVVGVDLPKSRQLSINRPLTQKTEQSIAVDVPVERNLGARKQTYCNIGFVGCRKSARDGLTEPGCDQLVSDLGGTAGNIMHTIVTH